MSKKAQIEVYEQEKRMLKLTIEYLVNENVNLKENYNTLDSSVKKNKNQLQEYLNNITDKETAFQSLNSKIVELRQRLQQVSVKKRNHTSRNINIYSDENIKSTSIEPLTPWYTGNNSNKNKILFNILPSGKGYPKKCDQEWFNKEKYWDYCNKQNTWITELNDIKNKINNILQHKYYAGHGKSVKSEVYKMESFIEQESIEEMKAVLNKEGKVYWVDKGGRVWKVRKRCDLSDKFKIVYNNENESTISFNGEQKNAFSDLENVFCATKFVLNNRDISDCTVCNLETEKEQKEKNVEVKDNVIFDSNQQKMFFKYKSVNEMMKDSFIL